MDRAKNGVDQIVMNVGTHCFDLKQLHLDISKMLPSLFDKFFDQLCIVQHTARPVSLDSLRPTRSSMFARAILHAEVLCAGQRAGCSKLRGDFRTGDLNGPNRLSHSLQSDIRMAAVRIEAAVTVITDLADSLPRNDRVVTYRHKGLHVRVLQDEAVPVTRVASRITASHDLESPLIEW